MKNNVSEKIKILSIKTGITLCEVADKSGQSQSNLSNKLIRNDMKCSEMQKIADAFGAELEISFILPDGTKI